MYQLADKNKVMSLFHKGQSVSQIRLKSNVSKSTLHRWKAEYDTTGKIIGYIIKGQLEKAKEEITQFQETHKNSSVLLMRKVIGQFVRLGYLEEAKELAEKLLKRNPNDLPARSQLVSIAMKKGNLEETERLCREILALNPNDEIAKKQLKSIQKMQKKVRGNSKEGCQIVQEKKPKQATCSNVQIIRNQIQAGTFLLDDIEARKKEMQEMGIDEVRINLLLAEAYERQNLPKQTKTYLKKALQGTQEPKLQKIIKTLLETAQTQKKKTNHINPWDSIAVVGIGNTNRQTSRTSPVLDEK